MWHELHWLRPHFLWLLIPSILFTLYLLYQKKRSEYSWSKLCDPHLIPYLLKQSSIKQTHQYFPTFFWLIVLNLGIVGLAGPSWNAREEIVYRNAKTIVIALDMSENMQKKDVQPDRLERAKYKITDLLKQFHHQDIGLITFTSMPFVVTPMTQDETTIENFLMELNHDIIPVLGHRIDHALIQAEELIKQHQSNLAEIILITASQPNEKDIQTAQQLSQQKIITHVFAIGEKNQLPLNALKQLATQGGGKFVLMTTNDEDIKQFNSMPPNSIVATKQRWQQFYDQGYLFALCLLPFALLWFRRGWLNQF